jgi:predicted RNase H-like nuclease (RuvC/YqgF family)
LASALDFALIQRLREVVRGQKATESELRTLAERADAWARTLESQIHASERQLRRLSANPSAPIANIAEELRRIDRLRPQLTEVRSLLDALEVRARELRTAWLLHRE